MKKFWILLPVLLLSCTKDPKIEATVDSLEEDSTFKVDYADSTRIDQRLPDSIVNQSQDVQRVLETGIMREESATQIVRYAEAKMLPFTIGDEIKTNEQNFILKLAQTPKGPLKILIETKDPQMNIRVNQVRYPDGTLDGPFGRSVELDVPVSGEVWLILRKSNMASSSPVGKFTVTLE